MKFLFLFSFLLFSSCSTFGIQDVEEPKFDLLLVSDDFEIRKYKPYCIAEVIVKGEYRAAQSEGFRILAGYIFGDNITKEKVAMTAPVMRKKESTQIAMTAPVMTEKKQDHWVITFSMPSEYNLKNLPEPLDKRVILKEAPEKTVAVLGFSGFANENNVEHYTNLLSQWLERPASRYTKTSPVLIAGYNPPWTLPFLRRNEVMYEVVKKK